MSGRPDRPGTATTTSERAVQPAHVPARQRWRLTFAREADQERRSHREIVDQWTERLASSGLPLPAATGRQRMPLTFAAPLPAGMECRRELADLWLMELVPAWRVRESLARTLPADLRLLAVDDVWVGAPALAAVLRAADYRIALPADAPLDAISAACRRFLATSSFVRDRRRGSTTGPHDIRALVADVRVDSDMPALIARTMFLQDRGAGRPEDVIGAVEDLVGTPLEPGEIVRERLVLES